MVWAYHIHYYFPNNTVLLVTIDKFDLNPMLVNINRLKPYRFIEDKTLQPILVKLGDLMTNEPVQTKEPIPLPVELEDFEPVRFEPIINHLKQQMCLFIINLPI
jgi:hypothetical protein